MFILGCGEDDREAGPCVVGTSEGCGEDETCVETQDGELVCVCVPGTTGACEDNQMCEQVLSARATEPDGLAACFARVEIRGRVFSAMTDEGIQGATVVALDANGGARSTVATTETDGSYALPVSVPRRQDGTLVDDTLQTQVTLRSAAAGFQVFPTAPRTAIPIDLSESDAEPEGDSVGRDEGTNDSRDGDGQGSGVWVVQNAATDVALIPLRDETTGLSVIRGSVDSEEPGGVLVVAVQAGTAVSTAVTDSDGAFTLFNVPPGSTLLDGFRSGLNVEEHSLTVDDDSSVEDVVLSASAEGLATVSGSVNIVNAPGGSMTTVILVLESTFVEHALFARGEAPAGLRAQDVAGAFAIGDVPPGEYVVLAAFENDDLVRDPDTTIGGTEIVHIEVPNSGGSIELPESFKVTEALAVFSPGAEGTEVIDDAAPRFTWADDSSEDGYELRVYDAFGELVHEDLEVPRETGSATVSYTWPGASLELGMIYQFRVVSYHDPKKNETERAYISATEDLRGVFQYGVDPQGDGQ